MLTSRSRMLAPASTRLRWPQQSAGSGVVPLYFITSLQPAAPLTTALSRAVPEKDHRMLTLISDEVVTAPSIGLGAPLLTHDKDKPSRPGSPRPNFPISTFYRNSELQPLADGRAHISPLPLEFPQPSLAPALLQDQASRYARWPGPAARRKRPRRAKVASSPRTCAGWCRSLGPPRSPRPATIFYTAYPIARAENYHPDVVACISKATGTGSLYALLPTAVRTKRRRKRRPGSAPASPPGS